MSARLSEYLGGCDEQYTVSANARQTDTVPDAWVTLYARDEIARESVHLHLTPADARGLAVRLLLAADQADELDRKRAERAS